MEEMKNKCNMLFEKPEGRPRRRWKDNVKIVLKEKCMRVCTGLKWLRIGSSGGFVNTVIIFQFP